LIDSALRLAPGEAGIEADLGAALNQLGSSRAAVLHLGRALRKLPGDLDARFQMGVALDALGLPEEASAQFAAVLKADPSRWDARYNLALDRLRQGRPAEAAALLKEVVAARPFAQAYNTLGAALASLGDVREAEGAFQKALELEPGLEEARANMSRLGNG
jgi:tetratricopeptide (TPR) repeat protein